MNVPSLCTAGNIGWALPMNIASMWGFSLENGGVSKSGVRTVYRPSVRGVHLRPRGAVLLGAVGARAVCVWSRGRRRTKLRTGVTSHLYVSYSTVCLLRCSSSRGRGIPDQHFPGRIRRGHGDRKKCPPPQKDHQLRTFAHPLLLCDEPQT